MNFIKITDIIEEIINRQDGDPVFARYLQRVDLAARTYCKQRNINIDQHWFYQFPNGQIFPNKEEKGAALIEIGGKTLTWNEYVVTPVSYDLGKKELSHPNDGLLYHDIRDYRDKVKEIDPIYYQYLGNVLAAAKLYCCKNDKNIKKHIFHNNKNGFIRPDLVNQGRNILFLNGSLTTWDKITGSPAFLITKDNTSLIEMELSKIAT